MAAPETSILESVLGCSLADDPEAQMLAGYKTLTGRSFTCPKEMASYSAEITAMVDAIYDTDAPLPIELQEDFLALFTLGELAAGGHSQENPLMSWPIYKEMIDKHGHRLAGGNALMIGAISPFSARSFERLAMEEYGASRAHVVDVQGGKDKAQHGNFVYGSGLQLPYASGSMDIIQTNQLLHMLRDPADPESPLGDRIEALFDETLRVLAPRGQLLMTELGPQGPGFGEAFSPAESERVLKTAAYIGQMLEYVGFDRIAIERVCRPQDDGFLTDPTRDFSKWSVRMVPDTLSVYASKAA